MKLSVLILMNNDVAYSITNSTFHKVLKEEMLELSKQVANEYFTDMGYNYSPEDITYIFGKNDLEIKDKKKRDLKDIVDNTKIIYDNNIDFIITINGEYNVDNLYGIVMEICNFVIDINYTNIELNTIVESAKQKYPEKFEGKVVAFAKRR